MAVVRSALWYRCHAFITEQSRGEWSEADILEDTKLLFAFITRELKSVEDESRENELRFNRLKFEFDRVIVALNYARDLNLEKD